MLISLLNISVWNSAWAAAGYDFCRCSFEDGTPGAVLHHWTIPRPHGGLIQLPLGLPHAPVTVNTLHTENTANKNGLNTPNAWTAQCAVQYRILCLVTVGLSPSCPLWHCPARWGRILPYIAHPGKNQNMHWKKAPSLRTFKLWALPWHRRSEANRANC